MGAAPVSRVVVAREAADCAIASIATYLGVTYEDVLRAVVREDTAEGRAGLTTEEMIAVSGRLGTVLRFVPRKAIEEIEDVYGIALWRDHAAVVRNGLIVEVDGSIWEFEVYQRATRRRLCGVLIADEP